MIYIASDHGGYQLKKKLVNHLKELQLDFVDLGTDNDTESVDYPDYGAKACREIIKDLEHNKGILICGSGIGISIAANRFHDIRAALVYNEECAKLARQHNNANVICFGGRIVNHEDAISYLDIFLNTKFEGGRHCRRVDKLTSLKGE